MECEVKRRAPHHGFYQKWVVKQKAQESPLTKLWPVDKDPDVCRAFFECCHEPFFHKKLDNVCIWALKLPGLLASCAKKIYIYMSLLYTLIFCF